MDWETQKNYLKNKIDFFGFEQIFIMDNDGYGYYVKGDIIKNQSSEDFAKYVLNNDKYISEPFAEYTLNRSIITLTLSIKDEEGNKIGAICGTVNLVNINKIIEEFVLGENGFSIVINKNGEYVAAKDMLLVHCKENFYLQCNKDEKSNDIELLKDTADSGVGFIKLGNVKYCASYKNLEINDWKVILAMPEKEVLEQSNTYQTSQIINTIALIFLMLGIIIILYNWINNEKKSYKDGLTKIFNRDKFNRVVKILSNNNKDRIIVVCFDLNNLKDVNDFYGHSVGDELIIDFSKILVSTFNKVGFVSRTGGDEFIVILKNLSDKQINKYILQLEKNINNYNNMNHQNKISAAFGYAIKEKEEDILIEKLINEADKKMYINKEKCKKFLEVNKDV